MATGHRVIERGLRPDGTPRKPLKIREGYHPPDEAVAYVPPHKKDQPQVEVAESATLSLESRLMSEESPIVTNQPKTKSQIKNEKRNKNRREKKLELANKLGTEQCKRDALLPNDVVSMLKGAPDEVDISSHNHTPLDNGISDSNSLPITNGFDGEEVKFETDGSERKSTKRKQMLENPDIVIKAISNNLSNMDEITDLERQQKKLKKKIEQLIKLVERGGELNNEEKVKVGKRDEWEDEMRMVEKRLKSLKTK